MKQYHFTAIIWKEGRRYVSKCPELGVASYGATPEGAREALAEGVQLYLSNAQKLGLLKYMRDTLDAQNRYTTSLDIAVA